MDVVQLLLLSFGLLFYLRWNYRTYKASQEYAVYSLYKASIPPALLLLSFISFTASLLAANGVIFFSLLSVSVILVIIAVAVSVIQRRVR